MMKIQAQKASKELYTTRALSSFGLDGMSSTKKN